MCHFCGHKCKSVSDLMIIAIRPAQLQTSRLEPRRVFFPSTAGRNPRHMNDIGQPMFIRVYVRQTHFNSFRSPRRHNLKVPPRRRPTRSPGWKRSPKIRRFRPDPKHLPPSSQGHPSSTSPGPDRFDPKGRLPGVLVCQRYTFWPAANFKRETPSIPHPHISATDDLRTYVEASSKEFLMRSIYVVTCRIICG